MFFALGQSIRGKIISLLQAGTAFVGRVRDGGTGERPVIRNGAPTAGLALTATGQCRSATQEAALARTRARMETGWPIAVEKLDRDALHER